MACDIGEYELGAVHKLGHHNITFRNSVMKQSIAKPVAVTVKFFVSPCLVLIRVDHGISLAIPPDIAHESLDPGVMAFENFFKIFHKKRANL